MKAGAILASCLLTLLSTACTNDAGKANGDITAVSKDWTQQEADAITQKCGAPAAWLKAVNGNLQFQPDTDGDYQVSVCILEALKASGKAKIGFVGNEKYVTPDKGE